MCHFKMVAQFCGTQVVDHFNALIAHHHKPADTTLNENKYSVKEFQVHTRFEGEFQLLTDTSGHRPNQNF